MKVGRCLPEMEVVHESERKASRYYLSCESWALALRWNELQSHLIDHLTAA